MLNDQGNLKKRKNIKNLLKCALWKYQIVWKSSGPYSPVTFLSQRFQRFGVSKLFCFNSFLVCKGQLWFWRQKSLRIRDDVWAPHSGAQCRAKLVHYAGCWSEDSNYLFDPQNPRVPGEKIVVDIAWRAGRGKAPSWRVPQKLISLQVQEHSKC